MDISGEANRSRRSGPRLVVTRRVALPLLALLAVVWLGAGQAFAHQPSERPAGPIAPDLSPPGPRNASVEPSSEWRANGGEVGKTAIAAGIITALLTLTLARRPRRLVTVVIALTLLVFAFESGLHSIHHLGNDRASSHCAVAWASAHLAIASAEVPAAMLVLPAVDEAGGGEPAALSSWLFRPDAGRAPPSAVFSI
jgi:hypothetical protein